MSFQAESWAWDQRCGSVVKKAILAYLAWRADRNTGESWPSVKTIAHAIECGERSVYRSLVELEKEGMVERGQRTAANGACLTTVYRLPVCSTPLPQEPDPPATEPDPPAMVAGNPSLDLKEPPIPSVLSPTPKPASQKRKKPAIPMPEGWHPDIDGQGWAYAEARGLDPEVTWAAFRSHHLAKGNTFISWHQAWQFWCNQQIVYGRGHKPVRQEAQPGLGL